MNKQTLKHFLLIYNNNTRHLDVEEFTDSTVALERYDEEERINFDKPYMNIVLVASDTLESVKITHANYFPDKIDEVTNAAMNINLDN